MRQGRQRAAGTSGRRRAIVGLTAVAALVALALGVVAGSGAQVTTAQVTAFPMPGTEAARPETQISLRGAPPAALGDVAVTGSSQRRARGHAPAALRRPGRQLRAPAAVPGRRDRDRPDCTRPARRARRRLHVPRRAAPDAGQRAAGRLAAAAHAAAGGGRSLPLAPRPPVAGRARHAALAPDVARPDLPRAVLAQGQPEAGRPDDHGRQRRPRVVPGGPARDGGHRPQGPAARRGAGADLVGGPLRARLGLRRLPRASTSPTASCRRSA